MFQWLLNLFSRRAMESEEDEEEVTAHAVPSEELNVVLKEIAIRLENLRTCYDLITKHGAALQRALSDLETPGDDIAIKTKTVNERATLFRITSNAMINVSQIKKCSYFQLYHIQGLHGIFENGRRSRTEMVQNVTAGARSSTKTRRNGGAVGKTTTTVRTTSTSNNS